MDNYLILFLIIGIICLLFYFKDKIMTYFLSSGEHKYNKHHIKHVPYKKKHKKNHNEKKSSTKEEESSHKSKEDTDIDDIFMDDDTHTNESNNKSMMSTSMGSANSMGSFDSKFSDNDSVGSYSLDSRSGLSCDSLLSGSNESRISKLSSNYSFGSNKSNGDDSSALSFMDN